MIFLVLFLVFDFQVESNGSLSHQEEPRIVRFQVPVNVHRTDTKEEELTLLDSACIYWDWGVLMLPENYSEKGLAKRLIILCHGAGGTVTGNGSQIEKFTLTKYLVSEGFAVMDMAGLPEKFAQEVSINPFNNMGSGIAVQSYIKGYHWIIENYNIKRDGVHLWGGSMGGLTSNNILYQSQIPVLSQSAACPVTDLYNQAWLYPWSNNAPRIAIAKLFNFYGMDKYEREKVQGFNPILTNSWLINGERFKIHGVPYKIWHADEDPIVNYQGSVDFVDAIKRTGGWAELRTLHAESHEPMDLGETVKRIRFNNEVIPITPVVEEMYLWIKRFD
ncbi:MAG: prolyl oligopeptidase family serine peptidase [Cyclobacteriaceae bacterium]